MVIYGVALLAICLLTGLFTGELLGQLIGVEANVGGVGIAMLMLILVGDWLNRRRPFLPKTREGVLFWSGIYIPIVVAMAARQNVVAAIDGGLAAFLAGAMAVVVGLLLVPVISRVGAEPATDAGGAPGGDDPPREER